MSEFRTTRTEPESEEKTTEKRQRSVDEIVGDLNDVSEGLIKIEHAKDDLFKFAPGHGFGTICDWIDKQLEQLCRERQQLIQELENRK